MASSLGRMFVDSWQHNNNNINNRPPACINQLLGLEKPLINFVRPKATTMRLLVSYHSVLSTSTRAGGYYHYSLFWFLCSSANSNSPSLRKQKNSRMDQGSPTASTQGSPTASTPYQHPHKQVLRLDTLHRDPLAADDGSKKKTSTTLERQPREINEVNDVTVQGFPIDAGGRWETSNLIVVA